MMQKTCKLGFNYLEMCGGERLGCARRIPCCGKAEGVEGRPDLGPVTCSKFELNTPEEIAAHDAQIAEIVTRFKKTLPWVSAMKKKFPNGCGAEKDTCPICGKDIGFRIAPGNMHMWARCETENCVSFIE